MQGSEQTSPSQDRQIFLNRTGIKESQLPLTSGLSHCYTHVLSAAGAAASEAAELTMMQCVLLSWGGWQSPCGRVL